MKTKAVLILFAGVLFCVAGVNGQITVPTPEPTPKGLEELKRQAKKNEQSVKYDKFDDYTRIRGAIYDLITIKEMMSNAFISDNQIRSLKFTPVIIFHGDELTVSNARYLLAFSAESQRFKFTGNARLTFLADGERLRYEPVAQDWDVDGLVGEQFSFLITRADLEKLANAKVLEMKLGDFTKKLNGRHQKVMRQTLTMGDLAIRAPQKG